MINNFGIPTGLISDSNPLAVQVKSNQARGQFHRLPNYSENRFFRIRKGARQINNFELANDEDDYKLMLKRNFGDNYEELKDQFECNDFPSMKMIKDSPIFQNMLNHFRRGVNNFGYSQNNFRNQNWKMNIMHNQMSFGVGVMDTSQYNGGFNGYQSNGVYVNGYCNVGYGQMANDYYEQKDFHYGEGKAKKKNRRKKKSNDCSEKLEPLPIKEEIVEVKEDSEVKT